MQSGAEEPTIKSAESTGSRFLNACAGEPVDATPVWFMRQAGRSLPEYRAARERYSLLEICRTPEVAVEVTLQPVHRLGVDAAVLFSDIMVPLLAVGIELDIVPGVGPVIDQPVRSASDLDRLRPLDAENDVPFVVEAVRGVVAHSPVPLIGFGGGPYTLASYLIEGSPAPARARTKALMREEPATWHKLMDRLAEIVLGYLRAQVRAGAHAVQLFDSWAGDLAPADYREHVLPAVERILGGLAGERVPRIHFGVGTGPLLELMWGAGADVMGIDAATPLSEARRRLGPATPLQGNLDPAACLAPWESVRERADEVMREASGGPHVFNLGHGVLPQTEPDTLARLVAYVHGWSRDG